MKKAAAINVKWISFPLHPETPPEGRTLADLFAASKLELEQKLSHLKSVATAEGLPLGDRKKTFNSRLAQELGKWAETKGQGDAFHDGVFRAYFADGKNIAENDFLIEFAESLNLSGSEAESVLNKRTYKQAVDSDWSYSREMGVTAVPTFRFNGQMMVGAQPYEQLRQLVS